MCAVKAIKPELREVRKTVIQQIHVARLAAQQYTALVHRLTDKFNALDNVADIVLAIRQGLDTFVKTADKAANTLFSKADRLLFTAIHRVKRNCPGEDLHPILHEVGQGLRRESKVRIQQQSNPRLFEIVGKATQKVVRGNEQAFFDDNEDETNRITLVLRDVFALLIELFTVEIKDRQRQYFAYTEQLLLSAVVQAKRV